MGHFDANDCGSQLTGGWNHHRGLVRGGVNYMGRRFVYAALSEEISPKNLLKNSQTACLRARLGLKHFVLSDAYTCFAEAFFNKLTFVVGARGWVFTAAFSGLSLCILFGVSGWTFAKIASLPVAAESRRSG